jgi:hypothetical protein
MVLFIVDPPYSWGAMVLGATWFCTVTGKPLCKFELFYYSGPWGEDF